MNTDDLREGFLAFFEGKGCVRRPSDVLVPHGDRSVLFTPAGMNQFKEQFLGRGNLEFTRATTCQKCLRVGDIEEVGKTAYHHTFFEMLGNFSFGDYFKREAIHWAWEFLTTSVDGGGLGLEADRLSASVFLDDDEAYDIWRDEIGLPAQRVRRDDEHENFWPAGAPSEGPDGVCGPCSEIFYRCDDGDEVEIWNLVFTQYHRVGPPPDNLHPLPRKNIDTGMGLERTAAVLQRVSSNFEIDLFKPLIHATAELTDVHYAPASEQSPRIRRIADHARGVTFCIHENVYPSNEKQGSVVRRLLRRAVLDGHRLGLREPFFHRLVPVVVEAMKRPYPDLVESAERVAQTIKIEEERFLATLEKGLQYFESVVRTSGAGSRINRDDAFKLHATYGFPIELTEALAAERNLAVDRAGFEQLMSEHAEISGKGAFTAEVFKAGPMAALKESMHRTEFLGYEMTEADGVVKGIVAQNSAVEELDEIGHERPIVLVLDRSPFYGEAGGQVGDTGVIHGSEDAFEFQVVDTQRDDELILHLGHLVRGRLRLGDRVRAEVDVRRRAGIRRAHSATHLLHHALRSVLGSHAQQAGSKVDDDYLRFDFANPQAVAAEQLQRIEEEIHRHVLEAAPVRWEIMPLDEARRRGAMALFGEKYPDFVRVVSMGDFSRELCGGTHLNSTAEVGLVKIVGEESVSAGTRRITALTGRAALDYVREEEQRQAELAALLRASPAELPRRVEALLEEVRSLKRQLKERRAPAEVSTDQLLADAVEVAGVRVIAREVPGWDSGQMRAQIDLLRRKGGAVAVLLASRSDGRAQLIGGLSEDVVQRGLEASRWIREVASIVGGGGGGRADMAQAGGKEPEKLDDALRHAVEYMQKQLKTS